nr:hypothetical protein [uncultured Methanobrevibacter sp.]
MNGMPISNNLSDFNSSLNFLNCRDTSDDGEEEIPSSQDTR